MGDFLQGGAARLEGLPRWGLLLGQAGSESGGMSVGWGALIALLLMIAASVWLGTQAQRAMRKSAFMKSYFIGNRSLGSWTLALTATVQSGGTFMGFPSLVYSYGWVIALWIAAYMVVPLTGFGLIGKRFAQLSRKLGAITVPDLLRERYGNAAVGLTASLLILFFMTVMMIAQFKAGALIMKVSWPGSGVMSLAEDGNPQDDYQLYLIGLAIFSLTVVGYTLIGGFLAAVWTDLFQSVLMFFGVMLLLPLAWAASGGLPKASEYLQTQAVAWNAESDLIKAKAEVSAANEARLVDMHRRLRDDALQAGGRWPDDGLAAAPESLEGATYFGAGRALDDDAASFPLILTAADSEGWRSEIDSQGRVRSGLLHPPGALLSGPGPNLYVPIGVAFSYFFVWVFSGVGSPAGVVRVMATKDSATVRRSIFLLATYNMFIYIPLILICMLAHSILPGLGGARSDEIIPRVAVASTQFAGGSFITGLILAAPFGAVMATVSSYLVVIAAGVVRDVYQRFIRPEAEQRELRLLSYGVMILIGVIGVGANLRPVTFLQTLVVFSGTCGATTFVAPYFMAAYWRRSTAAGVMAAMIGGVVTNVGMYAAGVYQTGQFKPIQPLNIDPIIWGLLISSLLGIVVSLMTAPPAAELVSKLFDADEPRPEAEPAAEPTPA